MRWGALPAGLALSTLASAAPALGAGGARVVDDAAVETPGVCNTESWLTGSSGGNWLFQLAPACTLRAVPMLEVGGALTHSWARGSSDTVLGAAAKVNLVDETQRGWGVAISAGIGWSVDRGEADSATINVPLTVPVGSVRLNVNASWLWSRADGHGAFVGVQADWTVRPDVDLVAEVFTRDTGRAGGQIGVRWTPGGGNLDFDLIAGRYIDGVTPTSITAGVIVRF